MRHKCDVWIHSRISAALNWIEFDTAEMRRMNWALEEYISIVRQYLLSDSWGKDPDVWKKTSSSQIQLIPLIAALVLSLAINFYLDRFRVSWGKSLWFAFYEENGVWFTLENSFCVEKKLEKMTQNLRVKPSIFNGLKTRRHVVSHEPSELLFWLLTAVKSNCFHWGTNTFFTITV